MQDVPLSVVNVADRTFQYRLSSSVEDLQESLAAEGQQEPVHLAGAKPHRIVDGFRRIEAIQSLGWPSVKAFVHHNLAEVDAHVLAFHKNVVRRNLSPLERANAIAQAMARGMAKATLARRLRLSVRQLHRYEQLLTLPVPLQALVDDHQLSMIHARLLADFPMNDPKAWAQRIHEETWTPAELRRELKKTLGKNAPGRKHTYIKRSKNALRFNSFKISRRAPKEQRDQVIALLKEAIAFLEC